MAQIFSIVQKGELFDQDVLNVFWYHRSTVGLPTPQDLANVELAWFEQLWPDIRAVLTLDYKLKQTIVQGWRDTWQREPFLPQIKDYPSIPGLAAGPTAPPLVCGILSARVEPQEPGPQIYKGVRTLRPVRRGYWAVSGLPRDGYDASGKLTPSYLASAPLAAFAAAVDDELTTAGATEPSRPIRVSQPLKGEIQRGFGWVRSAVWRSEISSRRSRKVGRGG